MAKLKIKEGSLKVWVVRGKPHGPDAQTDNSPSVGWGAGDPGSQHNKGDELEVDFGGNKKYTFKEGELTGQQALPGRDSGAHWIGPAVAVLTLAAGVVFRFAPLTLAATDSSWMRVAVSLVMLGACLYIVLSKKYNDATQKWAFATLGGIVGFWLG